MNIRKIVSGISAFAVAVTAFAAMSVTANATEYTNQTPTTGNHSGVTAKGSGVYTTNSTGLAGVVADLSTLTDIDQATSVTVSFRTTVPTTSATSLVTLMYGVGDKETRGLNLAGSFNSRSYVKDGLVSYFGAEHVQRYYVNGNTTNNWASSVAGKTVDAQIILNRETGEYTTTLKCGTATITETGTVAVGTNITVVEAFTAGTKDVDITLSNIKVSYTVPYPEVGELEKVYDDYNVDNDGVYAKAYTCDITYKGIAIENVKVEVDGADEPSQTIPFGNGYTGDVRIGIILASKNPSSIENVTPTVTVNVQ